MAKSRSQIQTDYQSTNRYGTLTEGGITGQTHINTFNDVSNAMEHVGEGARILTDTAAVFNWSKGYTNKLTEPGKTGDISVSDAGALVGSWVLIKHNDTTVPSITGIPAANLIELHDLASNYVVSTDNYIYLKCTDISPFTVSLEFRKLGSGSGGGIPVKIELGSNKVETKAGEIEMLVGGLKMLQAISGSTKILSIGDTLNQTVHSISIPSTLGDPVLNGFIAASPVYSIQRLNGNVIISLGGLDAAGTDFLRINESLNEILLHSDNIKLDEIAAQTGIPATQKALYLDTNGHIRFGNIDFSGQVSGSLRLPAVNDISARNDLQNLVTGNMVLVRDDGDGRWADYIVDQPGDGTGTNATWIKLSDEDSVLNAQSAAGIRAAYLSNSGTEELTTALLNKLNSIVLNQASYLINFATINDAPTTGVPINARCYIGGRDHQFDGLAWIDISDDIDGQDIETLLDAHLGTEWKTSGGGGFALSNVNAGFWGSDLTNWIGSGGDLTSIQDLGSSQLYIPDGTPLKWNGTNAYIEADGTNDAALKMNDQNSSYMETGTGTFTFLIVIEYQANSNDRHIKFGGANTYKINPTGIEVRNSGLTTETLAYTFTSGTTYFIAIVRDRNGFHQLYVSTTELDIQHRATSSVASTVDLGSLNQLRMGETEKIYGFQIYLEELLESRLNEIYQLAKTNFTLGS